MKSKPQIALFLALLLALVGCGSEADQPSALNGSTHEVTHALGVTEAPTNPQRIVAIDELAGLAALTVGLTPKVVYASTGDVQARQALEQAGSEVRDVPLVTLPDLEELLSLAPDLIVGVGPAGPIAGEYEDVSKVAPTIVLDIEGEWRDLVSATAAAFAQPEVGKAQVALIEQQLATAKQSASTSLSLLGYSTEPFSMPPHSPVSTLIAEAGFTRPPWQQQSADSYSLPMSEELLGQQNADLIVMPDGAHYSAQSLLANPLATQLTGTIVYPIAERWFGVTSFDFYVIASDLAELASGGTSVISAESLPAAWAEFVALAS